MKQLTVLIAILTCSVVIGQRPLNSGRLVNPTPEPTEEQLAERKKKIEERREEYIANFLTTLEADEFQKQIIKLSLDSYFEEKLKIFTAQYDHPSARTEAFKALDDTHFKELETLISENDMVKLTDFVKGEFDDKEIKKARKKKKKN